VVERILERLDKVRRNGRNRWVACCPVHNDKTPSMTIKDAGDKVLMYCFGCGSKGPEIARALDLPVSVLFAGETVDFDKQKYKLEKTELDDKMFIAVYEAARDRKEVISHADFKRYHLAKSREDVRHQGTEGGTQEGD